MPPDAERVCVKASLSDADQRPRRRAQRANVLNGRESSYRECKESASRNSRSGDARGSSERASRARILTLFALVDVLGAVQSFVSSGAGTGEGPVDGAGVADRALVTRIRRAGVVEVAEQPCEAKATVPSDHAAAYSTGRSLTLFIRNAIRDRRPWSTEERVSSEWKGDASQRKAIDFSPADVCRLPMPLRRDKAAR